VKFLVDNQLPPALARFIAEDLRVEALHVVDVGLRDGTDDEIWVYASENDFVLFSKDDDFVTLYSKTPSARLLWVRIGNCRRIYLLKVVGEQWHRILERFEHGDQFVELR
jgi:predicted nuclease of predicted toxin-antitoxin system